VGSARQGSLGNHAKPMGHMRTVSHEKITDAFGSPEFPPEARPVCFCRKRASYRADACSSISIQCALTTVALLQHEFMLTEACQSTRRAGQRSGRSDEGAHLGVPVVGVEPALRRRGYFRRQDCPIRKAGSRHSIPVNDPGQLPIRPLRQPNGESVRSANTNFPAQRFGSVAGGVSGRAKLYLLDTNGLCQYCGSSRNHQ